MATKARIDCHDENDIAEMENVFDQLDRTRWIKHNSGLLAEVVDLRENTVEMDRRGRLRWNEEMIGASLGKVDEVALGLDDHQVHIKRLTRVAPDRFDNHGPNVIFGTKRPSITST